jgi:hypothetical protein
MTVGILAFGSVVDDPGAELQAAAVRRIEVDTPFAVEFARSSRIRDGAPTLVPVSKGGSSVRAVILVLEDSVGERDARRMLYRRESGRTSASNSVSGAGSRWIAALTGFGGRDTCLYTALPANISPLSADRLAELAIHSATAAAGIQRRDGISYLADQQRRGVQTPLMPAYVAEVLARTGGRDLGDAWERTLALPSANAASGNRGCRLPRPGSR